MKKFSAAMMMFMAMRMCPMCMVCRAQNGQLIFPDGTVSR